MGSDHRRRAEEGWENFMLINVLSIKCYPARLPEQNQNKNIILRNVPWFRDNCSSVQHWFYNKSPINRYAIHNGVQEAGSSNLLTRTRKSSEIERFWDFSFLCHEKVRPQHFARHHSEQTFRPKWRENLLHDWQIAQKVDRKTFYKSVKAWLRKAQLFHQLDYCISVRIMIAYFREIISSTA